MVIRKKVVLKITAAILATATAGFAQQVPYQPGPDGIIPQAFVALTNTQVLDVRTGEILHGAVVVVRNGTILSVSVEPPPTDAVVMDMEGAYLVPGFIDAHFHGRSMEHMRRAVESGVTTMRAAGVGDYRDVRYRDLVRQGYLAGPDMLAAGLYVRPNFGEQALADPRLNRYLNTELRGTDAVREVVRINAEHSATWVKTRSGGSTSSPTGPDPFMEVYTVDELEAIVDEASKHGMKVACHAHGPQVIKNAIRAGCATLEHASFIDDEGLEMMLEAGTVWVPTYTSVFGFALPFGDYESAGVFVRAQHTVAHMKRMLARGHAMGITIIASTDTMYGPKSDSRVSREITDFVDFGMTPLEAIQSATTVPAEFFGLADTTGAIEPGLEADLVAFPANPLDEIYTTHEPLFVMSNGRLVYHRTANPETYIGPQYEFTGFGQAGPRP
jgi:imidazolonepropionase-like amidohydrolase